MPEPSEGSPQNTDEIRKVVENTVEEVLARNVRSRKLSWRDVLQILVTPLTVAAVSAFVTWKLTTIQEENAIRIANAQLDGSREIAQAQIENARQLALAQTKQTAEHSKNSHRIEQLSHLRVLYKDIIKASEESDESLASQISALAVYEDTALPFLLRLRSHYESQQDKTSLRDTTEETIRRILTRSQLDFSFRKFCDDRANSGGQKPLRYAKLGDYNLTGADFSNCNLYRADFSQSTLAGALFDNTDLDGANFANADLTKARFGPRTDLTETNFVNARLDRTKFVRVQKIVDAQFSLKDILRGVFSVKPALNETQFLKLLSRHYPYIEKLGESDPLIVLALRRLKSLSQSLNSAKWGDTDHERLKRKLKSYYQARMGSLEEKTQPERSLGMLR